MTQNDTESKTVEQIEVGRFTVDPRHKIVEECPDCGDEGELFHLGETHVDGDRVEGWVCGTCRAELHQHNPEEDGELTDAA